MVGSKKEQIEKIRQLFENFGRAMEFVGIESEKLKTLYTKLIKQNIEDLSQTPEMREELMSLLSEPSETECIFEMKKYILEELRYSVNKTEKKDGKIYISYNRDNGYELNYSIPDQNPVDENPVDENPVDENPVDEIPVDEITIKSEDQVTIKISYDKILEHLEGKEITTKSVRKVIDDLLLRESYANYFAAIKKIIIKSENNEWLPTVVEKVTSLRERKGEHGKDQVRDLARTSHLTLDGMILANIAVHGEGEKEKKEEQMKE